jgi:hypothetical protein
MKKEAEGADFHQLLFDVSHNDIYARRLPNKPKTAFKFYHPQ